MRLVDEEHSAISDAIHQADANATIYLFGSRVDGAAKGGDIDLLVQLAAGHLGYSIASI